MHRVGVVIPTYRSKEQVLGVLGKIGPEVDRIYVVDDCCPDYTGIHVSQNCRDSRVRVIRHSENLGVGGAVMTGYQAAMQDGLTVIVKLDSDGQMNPEDMPQLIYPIIQGVADYSKGNRFFELDSISVMPPIRIFGNAVLSLMSKFSSGYWNISDPNNGYTAIHIDALKRLPLNKISKDYFFESDMLFRLNTLKAVVQDVPMKPYYGSEVSNLIIRHIFFRFLFGHFRNFAKRIFYNYYLRDMSLASIQLPFGLVLTSYGLGHGIVHWIGGTLAGVPNTAGAVMLSAPPIIIGFQLLLGFIGYDVYSVPTRSIQSRYRYKH